MTHLEAEKLLKDAGFSHSVSKKVAALLLIHAQVSPDSGVSFSELVSAITKLEDARD